MPNVPWPQKIPIVLGLPLCAGEAGALSSPRPEEERQAQLFYLTNGHHFEHILSKTYFRAKGSVVTAWKKDSVNSELPFRTGSCLSPL